MASNVELGEKIHHAANKIGVTIEDFFKRAFSRVFPRSASELRNAELACSRFRKRGTLSVRTRGIISQFVDWVLRHPNAARL